MNICKVMGVSNVLIKKHDRIVMTLCDVRHVPGFKKDIISLGTLDAIACGCICEGGVMKIAKGSLILMRGIMNDRLYVIRFHGY